jgi:hypothetical protein
MFCPFCQTARVENEAPCPNCGAQSPLLGRSQANNWQAASWGGPSIGTPQQWSPSAGPQLSFDAPPSSWSQQNSAQQPDQQQFWSHVSGPLGQPAPQNQQADQQQFWSHTPDHPETSAQNQYWSQAPDLPAQQNFQNQPQQAWSAGVGIREASPAQNQQMPLEAPSDQRQSMLPAIYQGGAAPQVHPGLSHLTQQLIPVQNIEHLLPALPSEEEAVYVPPMYTKPRPIIPRYRIISGFLSIIIVSMLVCAGATYYAKASGTLTHMKQFVGLSTPPTLKPTAQANIPDPPDKVDEGPAKDVIRSAATTARVDKKTIIAVQPQKIFAVNQEFFVTYSVSPQEKDGQVTVRWYMNDHLFQSKSVPVKAKNSINGFANEQFAIPAPGKVELLWNDQLARTLYFVVR